MKERKGLMDGLFPPKYDFQGMLVSQAEATLQGMELLLEAMKGHRDDHLRSLTELEVRTDDLRHDMERKLEVAFTTPFDRQDIYSVSRQMKAVMSFARTTLLEMDAFGVEPDRPMLDMAGHLLIGTREVVDALRTLGNDDRTSRLIDRMREEEGRIEETYISGMKGVFLLPDHMMVLKKREIYHHLKDAGR
ncbi:MAG TPA: DUF47 family protein, partial [Methanomassiliicoccales archaeon]|nr:DUF47 family protein [Methanomassiliicoccales archaeon]